MSLEPEIVEEGRARATEAMPPPKLTPAELLVEQYKLLEDRRKYFGSQFMQTIGGVGAILSILLGLLGGKPENRVLLRPTLVIGGFAFILLAFLSYRLGKRQDDCEQVMGEIESFLRSIGYTMVANMPRGARRFGARKAIVLYLFGIGATLVVTGFIAW